MSYLDINKRHDFVLLFDVTNGNPNGDPDAGNLPRVDPETMLGLVTDVCIKRKVRNFVDMTRENEAAYKIYVQSGVALNAQHKRAYEALGKVSTGTKQVAAEVDEARKWMCANFYDIRMFGAVMTTGVNCGQVLGPLQLTFARSISPVLPLDVSITRVAVTKEEDLEKVVEKDGKSSTEGKRAEMGRKSIVPYGLYKLNGFFNPHHARKTGVVAEDLAVFWQALQNMWDFDRSASRGMMACQGLYIFSHESALGNAPANQLFKRVDIRLKDGVEAPRSVDEYAISVDAVDLPEGITLTQLAV